MSIQMFPLNEFRWYPEYPGHGPHKGEYALYQRVKKKWNNREFYSGEPIAMLKQTPTGWRYAIRSIGEPWPTTEPVPTKRITRALAYVQALARMQ